MKTKKLMTADKAIQVEPMYIREGFDSSWHNLRILRNVLIVINAVVLAILITFTATFV